MSNDDDSRRARLRDEVVSRDAEMRRSFVSDVERVRRALASEPQSRGSWRRAGKHGAEIAGQPGADAPARDDPLAVYGRQKQLGVTADQVGAVVAAVDAAGEAAEARKAVRTVRIGRGSDD